MMIFGKCVNVFFIKKMKNKDIARLFPQYNEKNLIIALKSIKAGRLYRRVSKEYLSSTTIENII